jgi:hypothetical protein
MDELSEIKKLSGAGGVEATDGFNNPVSVGDEVIVAIPGSQNTSYLGVGTIENIRDTAYDGIMVDVLLAKRTGGMAGGLVSVEEFSIMKI